jgi:aspartate aminotransferase-like enzyme
VPDEVINAMARQPTDLADARLASLIASCEVGMKRLLQTERAEVFFFAADGLGPLAGRVFRIGPLGDMNEAMILGCLAGVEAAMQVQRIAHGRGGVDAAIASLAMGSNR